MSVKGESIQPLGGNVSIIVSDSHHFSTDTILLSHFAAPKRTDKALELGSGCGTIPLLWSRENPPAHITAVEIQQDACDMMRRSVEMNRRQTLIDIICADMRELSTILPNASFDLVVCNPPYKHDGSGLKNPDKSKSIARHEINCTIDDVCSAAMKMLRFSGRFCMCHRAERLADVIVSLRSHKLEPKRIRFVQQRIDKEPKLVLIEAKMGANKGFVRVMPTLFIENENGDFSDEMKEIYGSYKETQ